MVQISFIVTIFVQQVIRWALLFPTLLLISIRSQHSCVERVGVFQPYGRPREIGQGVCPVGGLSQVDARAPHMAQWNLFHMRPRQWHGQSGLPSSKALYIYTNISLTLCDHITAPTPPTLQSLHPARAYELDRCLQSSTLYSRVAFVVILTFLYL